jgi:ankyrin repeat protein
MLAPSPRSPAGVEISVFTPRSLPDSSSFLIGLPWLRFQADLMEISKKHLRIVRHHANKETVNGASYIGTTNKALEHDLSVGISSSALAKIPNLLPTETEMRAMLPISVIDIRGPALGETATSIFNYFNLIMYLISNKMLEISEDLFVLLEIALTKGPFLSLLLKKTPTTRAFIQELFQSALSFRKTKIFSTLIDAELILDAWILQSSVPLRLATWGRATALAERLVRAGADLTGNWGSEALTNAAAMGNLGLVSFLIEKGANPNPQDTSNWYPILLIATRMGDEELVELLLKHGARVDTSFDQNNCPSMLASAARNGDCQLVQLLLDGGVHTDDRFARRETALGIAADRGHSKLAIKLLNAGAAVHPPLLRLLLGGSSNTEMSALYEAIRHGHQDVIKLLLEHRADPNTRTYHRDDPDGTGMTALYVAVATNNIQAVRLLLNAGARVNEINLQINLQDNLPSYRYRKETALQRAVRTSNTGLVKILLNAGAIAISPFSEIQLRKESEYQDNFSYNTVNLLVHNPDSEITGLLYTADPSAILKYGAHFLHSAIRWDDIEMAQFLLDAGVDVNGVPTESFQGTALQHAVSAGNFELAHILLDYGANVNAPPRGNHGRTALQSAAGIGSTELVHILLNRGADIHAPGTIEHGTALQLAAKSGYVEIVKLLFHFITIRDSQTNAPSNCSNSDTASNDWRSTMLPAAARGGLFEIVKLLLTEGADINTVLPGTRYGTALQEAVDQQDFTMVHFLLENHADPNIPGPTWVDQVAEWRTGTALQTAVNVENLELVRILLKAGARADVLSGACEDRRTPLEAAMEKFEGEDLTMLVQLLLAAGADVELTGIYSRHLDRYETEHVVAETTMLSAAIQSGNVQLVKILLEAGANVNAVSTYQDEKFGHTGLRSPLQSAVALADLDMSKILLEAGADARVDSPFFCPGPSPPFMWSPAGLLATAIWRGNVELFQLLLDSGAVVDSMLPTENSITALGAAAQMGNISIVEALLKQGAEVDGNVRASGGTALKQAATNGHTGIAFALLEAGADPTLAHPDESGSPLEKAVVRGRIDMVQMFLNAIKSRGTSGQDHVELLESSLKMALEHTQGAYTIAMGMIKTEIEDLKSV